MTETGPIPDVLGSTSSTDNIMKRLLAAQTSAMAAQARSVAMQSLPGLTSYTGEGNDAMMASTNGCDNFGREQSSLTGQQKRELITGKDFDRLLDSSWSSGSGNWVTLYARGGIS